MFNDNKITHLAKPDDDNDAATKKYVDDRTESSIRLGRKFKMTDDGKTSSKLLRWRPVLNY